MLAIKPIFSTKIISRHKDTIIWNYLKQVSFITRTWFCTFPACKTLRSKRNELQTCIYLFIFCDYSTACHGYLVPL